MASFDTADEKTLTVYTFTGLAARLRALCSGMALAEATGRRFRMFWPATPDCGAPFKTLFQNEWPVEDVDMASVASHNRRTQLDKLSNSDLLFAEEQHLNITSGNWLVRGNQYASHVPLVQRCREFFVQLTPVAGISHAVDGFEAAHFRPMMIGVHLRRGDLVRVHAGLENSTDRAIAAVDSFLRHNRNAGVLLCTDDGAVDPRNGSAQTIVLQSNLSLISVSVLFVIPRARSIDAIRSRSRMR